MMKLKQIGLLRCCLIRSYATKNKPIVKLNETVQNDLENETYKPKHHPGVSKTRVVHVPEYIVKSIQTVLADFPVKAIVADGETLSDHLRHKLAPVEKEEVRHVTRDIKEKVLERLRDFKIESENDEARFRQAVTNRVNSKLQTTLYNWKPSDYSGYNSLVYLVARAAPEFAVLTKIFSEIAERDPGFKPRSLFDFGSGVGTVTWAANSFWKGNIFEYFCVDSSSDMNDLAQLLLQGGRSNKPMPLRGVFYRQFLPASPVSYDLVVSAFSMLELPSRETRFETILNLWNKTQKYLVVVEQGTNAGFKIINEVRDFVLHTENSHVFSPCPHDNMCPRFALKDGTPCNFPVHYYTVPIPGALRKESLSTRRLEKYSYVVIKKGDRDESEEQWPRVVRETLIRSKHAICRMCTKNSKLEEVIVTAAKHGRPMYRCARKTQWGDRMPIDIQERNQDTDNSDCSNEVTESDVITDTNKDEKT